MESSNIFPTFLEVNASLLNRRGTPAIAISSIPETKNSGEQAESARKFEETVDERQRWLEPQVRIAASLPLMVPFLPRWPLWVHAVLSGFFSLFCIFFNMCVSHLWFEFKVDLFCRM